MGWCRTHNRIVTGNWTSCSVKVEDRGDCIPVWWGECSAWTYNNTETDHISEQRDDWADIVDRAFREGRIGHKGLGLADLNTLLFSPMYDPRQIDPPQGTYSHSHWQ